MKLLTMILALSLFLIAGCAGKVEYTPPASSYKVSNTLIVNKPKNDVWKQVITALGGSFFVINNMDKESGFLNVSYSGDPENYVDCGQLYSYVKNARGEREYRFSGSKSYVQYETFEKGQQLMFINRKMDLDGRVNIVISDIDKDTTSISVNTKYIVTKIIDMRAPNGASGHMNDSISFTTNGRAQFPNVETACAATGVLETDILNMLTQNIK